MRIISEKTGKEYKTVAECEAAEKAYDEKVAAEKAKKEALAATRKARAAEVEKAYEAAKAAQKNYNEILNLFLKDYHSYHTTIKSDDTEDLLSSFFFPWF